MVGLAGCANSVADHKGAPGVAQDVPQLLLDRAVNGLLQAHNKPKTHAARRDQPFKMYRGEARVPRSRQQAGLCRWTEGDVTCIPWLPSKSSELAAVSAGQTFAAGDGGLVLAYAFIRNMALPTCRKEPQGPANTASSTSTSISTGSAALPSRQFQRQRAYMQAAGRDQFHNLEGCAAAGDSS